MQKLISVDWHADFGFLKKPDVNEGIYLTYNVLHKPALLGMLGAVLGLSGYGNAQYMREEKILEYRRKLQGIPVAIQPLGAERGQFRKTMITYTNTVGYANDGSTLIVTEQTLIKPAYRTWLLLDDANEIEAKLLGRLQKGEATYIPYLGKNEFPVCWKNFSEWQFEKATPQDFFRVASVFQKTEEDRLQKKERGGRRAGRTLGTFMNIEQVPTGFQKMGKEEQYRLGKYVFTDFDLAPDEILENLWTITHEADRHIIQTF